MVEQCVTVKASVGLHARPAATFVKLALSHKCKVEIESNGKKVDGKSILHVLGLGVKRDQEIIIRTDGAGEVEALSALVNLIETTA